MKESANNKRIARAIYETWLNKHFTNLRVVQTCKICGEDVEMYGGAEDDGGILSWNGDSSDMEDHLTSHHDTHEWLKSFEFNSVKGKIERKALNDPDGELPYFDHEGKQIISNEYHSRYTFSDRI